MAATKKIKIGETIDLGKVGYVRLPDGSVVTSGPHYVARHAGKHVAFGKQEVTYVVTDDKPASAEPAPADPEV